MQFMRGHPERRYQYRLQGILAQLDRERYSCGISFRPVGHNILGLVTFEPPYDQLN